MSDADVKIENGNDIADENESTNGATGVDKKTDQKSPKLRRNSRIQTRAAQTSYIYDSHFKENHSQPLFGVAFNHVMGETNMDLFATAGGNRCTIYRCLLPTGIKMLMCFSDPDPEEVFYTCAWSYDMRSRSPLVATGGLRGIVRVFNLSKHKSVCNLVSHGQAINDLKFHPKKLDLLLSASKDHSVRLWNIITQALIAVFSGVEGHRDEVIAVDFHHLGTLIVSSGMDHALKIWPIDTPEFEEKIKLARSYNMYKGSFPTIKEHLPIYSTRDVHSNYVDCVYWWGNFIFSKSCENSIICWKPGELDHTIKDLKINDSKCTIIQEYEFDKCDIWFVRFALNLKYKIMALGKPNGKINVWELEREDPGNARSSTLSHPSCTSTIRQVAFSLNVGILVAVCDDGTIWRWNKKSDP